ncbi:hypothetical protein BGZ98_009913 [Dissophora globulifera]|nr:hypothetical protein BGZ98_009913 [Dissophora globulifera]
MVSSIQFDFNQHSHRRFNPLTDSWVLCSPHRTQRPWQGQEEHNEVDTRPSHDPTCYLCPRNKRAGGTLQNPDYKSTFIFENDFPSVRQDQPSLVDDSGDDLLKVQSVRGQCHVICFSPLHDKTLADMTDAQIRPVIDAWINTYESLRPKSYINHVQIFENKGAAMGCSNPHPHGQVWSTEDIPHETAQELKNMRAYRKRHGGGSKCMLCDYVRTETDNDRKARSSTTASALASSVPSAVPARVAVATTADGSRVVCENDSFVFELLGQAQRDLTPEQAAKRLADCSEVHYKAV